MTLFTHLIKAWNFFKKPNIDKDCVLVDSLRVHDSIRSEYKRMTGVDFDGKITAPDRTFLLPTDRMMSKIYKNYFIPFLEAFDLHYEKSFDCDNFGLTYCDVHTFMKMGLAVGFLYYYDTVDTNENHAIGFYLNNEYKLKLVEPQRAGFTTYELKPTNRVYFMYVQGIL